MPRGGDRKSAAYKVANGIPLEAEEVKPERPPRWDWAALENLVERSQARARNRPRTRDWCPFPTTDQLKLLHPPTATPRNPALTMAMDQNLVANNDWCASGWMAGGILSSVASEGLLFLGYPYLSELAQRPEFRVISETIATEMTRKWIRIKARGDKKKRKKGGGEEDQAEDADPDENRTGDNDKAERVLELTEFLEDLRVRDRFMISALHDGFFGRSHLFCDTGAEGDELKTPIGTGRDETTKIKATKGFLKRLKNIEPIWTYPTTYNAVNPLKDDWYNPQIWYVMGQEIHWTRLRTFIGRPVPDILKPAYSFGGLSLSQMAKPYVEIWLQTRQSVAEIVHSFSVMVLYTNLATLLQGAGSGIAGDVLARAAGFNSMRDNQGLFVVDKSTEDFKNISAPISGLHELQAQSQEHMMCLPVGTLIETARGKVPIELVGLDDLVLTRSGLRPIKWVGITDFRDTLIEIETPESVLRVTEEHPVWSASTDEFVNAASVSLSHRLLALRSRESMGRLWLGAADGGGRPKPDITATKRLAVSFIGGFGKRIAARLQKVTRFITETMTGPIISGKTWKWLPVPSTPLGIVASAGKDELHISGIAPVAANHSRRQILAQPTAPTHAEVEHVSCGAGGSHIGFTKRSASVAGPNSTRSERAWPDIALQNARSVPVTRVAIIRVPRQPVYNIEVLGPPEFFANDILVHNSVARIPATKFTGMQPSGMNASAEGEMKAFYESIHAYQPVLFGENLDFVIDLAMISLWGEIDEDIVFEWIPLHSLSEKEEAEVRKLEAETGQILVDSGIVSQEEERERIAADPKTLYPGIDPDDVPDLLEEEAAGLEPVGGRPQPAQEAELGEGGGKNVVPFGKDASLDDLEAALAPAPLEPPPAPAPPEPTPEPKATPAELEKAKKSVPLKIQYLSGASSLTGAAAETTQKLINGFNSQWEGKENLSPDQLEQKVAGYKALGTFVSAMLAKQNEVAEAAANLLDEGD